MILAFIMGFIAEAVASLDDTLVRIPVFVVYTKTRKGKILFSLGTLTATLTVAILTLFVALLVKDLPYTQEITIALIFFIAVFVYFEVGFPKTTPKKKNDAPVNVSWRFWIGFFVSFTTLLDDMLVILPLFIGYDKLSVFLGVMVATLFHIAIVFYFAQFLQGIKHKKQLASGALIVYGIVLIIQRFFV